MHTPVHYLAYKLRVYNSSMYHITNSKLFNQSDSAKFRLQVIEYYSKYGTQPTIDAFKISKATVFRWRKIFLDSNKNIYSLIPQSTKPHRVRQMNVDYRIIEYIRNLREQHPKLGKEKIKPLLDQYVVSLNLPKVSVSLIGKILRRYHMTSSLRKVYHNPNRKHAVRKKIARVRYAPKSKEIGYVQIDTIQIFTDGIRRYVFNAVDINTRFQFSFAYAASNTNSSVDFVKKLLDIYHVYTIQTDNGSEYLGKFDTYLKQRGVKHMYIYPRCPRINGCVERANRSLREEFLNGNQYLMSSHGVEEFNERLMSHLVWFNTKRVHKSLNNLSPIQYMLKYIPESHMYVTHTPHFNNCENRI